MSAIDNSDYRKRGRPRHISRDVVAFLQDVLRLHEAGSTSGEPLLTSLGDAFLRRELLRLAISRQSIAKRGKREGLLGVPHLPFWDGHRLWLGPKILKEFEQPAPHQRRILDALQHSNWHRQAVDDPLGLGPERFTARAQKCLKETVKNLNHGLPKGTIRVRVDETGRQILWNWATRSANPS